MSLIEYDPYDESSSDILCGQPPDGPAHRPWFVSVTRLDRHYGGPEEGGWWYDSGRVIHVFRLGPDDEWFARDMGLWLGSRFHDNGERFKSHPCDIDHLISVDREPATDFPQETPRYE